MKNCAKRIRIQNTDLTQSTNFENLKTKVISKAESLGKHFEVEDASKIVDNLLIENDSLRKFLASKIGGSILIFLQENQINVMLNQNWI